MRIAVIGAGRMGAIRATDLVTDPRVDDVVITNRNESRARALADELGGTFLPWADATSTDALAALDASGFVVALATDAHSGTLSDVLRTGLPTLCEKPIALTLEDTEDVIDLATQHGTPLQIGFQRRFDPGIRAMHERIAGGEVGVLYSLSLLSHDIAPSGREFIAGSGGIFRDLHVHDFDVVRWLTNSDIETVYATTAVRAHRAYAEFDDADTAVIHAVTESGASEGRAAVLHFHHEERAAQVAEGLADAQLAVDELRARGTAHAHCTCATGNPTFENLDGLDGAEEVLGQ